MVGDGGRNLCEPCSFNSAGWRRVRDSQREFVQEHLPDAMNVSLKKLTAEAVAGLDKSRPVSVYCWDDG